VPGLVSWVSSDLRYLGVNRHLAAAYQLPAEIFNGQQVGFLETSPKFNDLVYDFFASSDKKTSQEVTARIRGENKTYLIVAQKIPQKYGCGVCGIGYYRTQIGSFGFARIRAKPAGTSDEIGGNAVSIAAHSNSIDSNRKDVVSGAVGSRSSSRNQQSC
jgi:adenylate/guanylate cyclase